jgi:hypothetical protein
MAWKIAVNLVRFWLPRLQPNPRGMGMKGFFKKTHLFHYSARAVCVDVNGLFRLKFKTGSQE